MTNEEQTAMHIAQCQICTLGDAMKHCQACPFRIGLVAKLDAVLLPAAMPSLEELTASVYGQLDLEHVARFEVVTTQWFEAVEEVEY